MRSETTLSSTHPQPVEEAPILRKPDHEDPLTNPGVSLSEFVARRLNKGSIWALCIILGAIIYIKSLSDMMLAWASLFETPGPQNGTVAVIQFGSRAMRTAGILFFSRLADISSRPTSFAAALSFFVLGSIITSAAPNLPAFATGLIIQTIASGGLGLLTTLFIADYTLLKWRGLALSWTYFPYIINMWVAPRMYLFVNWRWIYGMFAILFPALCIPALVVLYSAAAGHQVAPSRTSWTQKVKDSVARMDLVGLVLFVAGCSLAEYALGLWEYRERSTTSAMLATGLILLFPVFFSWEILYAPFPLMPKRIFTNRAVTCGILANFFSYLAQTIPQRGLPLFVRSLSWNLGLFSYALNSSSMASSVFAPIIGVAFLVTRHYKSHLLLGNGVFILGLGLMVHCARIADPPESIPPTALIFAAQVLIGIGSIATELGLAVGSQASVAHDDLAIVVALMNAWSPISISFGSRIASAILNETELSNHTSVVMVFALGLGLSLFPFVLSLLMPNYVLGSTHNVIEEKGVTGELASGVNEVGGNI